jgi:hypothetical protein
LYATFVDGAVNIAPSLYGWYRDHLSSNWMFCNSALITPVMMICIYYGIPKASSAKKSGKAPSFAGFLYASAGLAMLLAACEQGERLDWWRSGVFNSLFAGGAFFLLCALVRRLRGPNPLVALPYLLKWNKRWPSAGSNPTRLDLRSSGALSHLFPSRSRLRFCCCANLIPVSSWPSALPVLPLLPG